MRNPIGPLPSSIYWRRRAIAASLVALLAVLAVWAVSSSGGDGGKDDNANGESSSAPSTIAPGPSRSGPAIDEQPGGRDDSGGTGSGPAESSGSGSGSGDAGTGGSTGSGSNTGTGGTSSGTGSGSGSDGGTGSGGSAPERVPAGSALPNCPSGALTLTLRTAKVSYGPGEKPSFQLTASNASTTTCKADFGPTAAVLTVTGDGDDEVWSSKDCPRPAASLLLKVPGGGSVTHTVEWDRRQSEPRCATPPAAPVTAGTYLVEARFPGETVLPASFRLEKN
ncbi:hypothetical protein [Streptomyces sp. NPDC020965]|uniref:hypothetical protein n=1 Tax=Streptomyces sp. NPDC020965 TaxID=3365105 RepID=UPI003791B410